MCSQHFPQQLARKVMLISLGLQRGNQQTLLAEDIGKTMLQSRRRVKEPSI